MTDTTGLPIDLGTYSMYRGDGPGRNCVVITLLDSNGDPVDLTAFGTTWKAQAAQSAAARRTPIDLTVTTSQLASGVIAIAVADADSATLMNHMDFDVQVSGGGVTPLTVFKGKFATTGQVTT